MPAPRELDVRPLFAAQRPPLPAILAAINQLAKSLACEWARDGIRVNSVAPWVTLTEMGKQVRGHGQAVCGVGRAGVRCLRWIVDIMQP